MEAPQAFEQLRALLPPYLTAERKRELFEGLRRFPDNPEIYLEQSDIAEPIQGDGQKGLSIREFATGDRRQVTGLILSNSCDIAEANDPPEHARMAFVPVMRLDALAELLQSAGKSGAQISSNVESIRRQEIATIFYLPAYRDFPECFAMLDNVYSQPLNSLPKHSERVFRLNQIGFYYFIIKLSIHFCRIREEVIRF